MGSKGINKTVEKIFIDDLKPGDKLDSLLCKHLLEWKVQFIMPDLVYGGEMEVAVKCFNTRGDERDLPKLSGTLSAAVRLVEAFEKHGRRVTIQYSGKRWYVWISSESKAKPDGQAQKLPLALARASLKACLGRDYIEWPVWHAPPRPTVQPGNNILKPGESAPEFFKKKQVTHMRIILEDK